MSMKIKVTIPSIEFVQADSAVRRSLFKILEAGGSIPENDMMEVWRGLRGPVRCEWAVKMAGTIQLRPTHIQELQEYHKRSTKLQTYLFADSLEREDPYYTDRLDEQSLYDLSSFVSSHVAAVCSLKVTRSTFVPWFVRRYVEMLSRGTRNSVLVPLLASPNQKLSKLAENAYSKVAINNLDNSSILK